MEKKISETFPESEKISMVWAFNTAVFVSQGRKTYRSFNTF